MLMSSRPMEMTRGNPATKRRIETRVVVKTETGSYGVSYRWNDAQTDATLVPEEGADQGFSVMENGVTRTQTWHFPSRAECLTCHTAAGGVARNPRGPDRSWDPGAPDELKRVHRGGSFLCTDQYCTRFRVGTRGKGEVTTGANHLGFRTVRSGG